MKWVITYCMRKLWSSNGRKTPFSLSHWWFFYEAPQWLLYLWQMLFTYFLGSPPNMALGPSEGMKIRGGRAGNIEVGIIDPPSPCWDRINWSGEAMASTAPGYDALGSIWRTAASERPRRPLSCLHLWSRSSALLVICDCHSLSWQRRLKRVELWITLPNMGWNPF